MGKRLVLVLVASVLMLGAAAAASAEFRLDIDVPWFLTVKLSPDLQSAIGTQFGGVDISKFAVIVPNLQPYWQFGGGPLKFGIGARVYTVLIMNFLYPSAFAELQLGRFDVNLNAGGFLGILAGIGPTFETITGPWFTMDLSAGFRVTNWFRIGLGAFAIADSDYPGQFPYAIYASGKFILIGK